MTDYSELKKAAEACGPLPWRLIECGLTRLGVRDDHGYIAFMDISHPAKYGPCPDREAKARFIGHATPATVLALIAENERLRRAEKNDAIAYKAAIERQQELRAECEAIRKDLDSHKRMLLAAAVGIGSIGEALGAEMDDDASEIEGLAVELRKDAERYRWLRDHAEAADWEFIGYQEIESTNKHVDALMAMGDGQ